MWSYAKFHFSIDLTILKIAKWIIFIEKQCMLICYACTCIYFMDLNIMDFTVWTTERRPDITTCSIVQRQTKYNVYFCFIVQLHCVSENPGLCDIFK